MTITRSTAVGGHASARRGAGVAAMDAGTLAGAVRDGRVCSGRWSGGRILSPAASGAPGPAVGLAGFSCRPRLNGGVLLDAPADDSGADAVAAGPAVGADTAVSVGAVRSTGPGAAGPSAGTASTDDVPAVPDDLEGAVSLLGRAVAAVSGAALWRASGPQLCAAVADTETLARQLAHTRRRILAELASRGRVRDGHGRLTTAAGVLRDAANPSPGANPGPDPRGRRTLPPPQPGRRATRTRPARHRGRRRGRGRSPTPTSGTSRP